MTATLRKIFTTAGEDFATTDEVAKALATLVVGLKGVREAAQNELETEKGKLSARLSALVNDIDSTERRLKELIMSKRKDASDEMKDIAREIRAELQSLENMIPDETDLAPLWEKVRDIESKIPERMDMLTAAQMRDALETLKGDDRLDASAVRGLEDFVKAHAPVRGFFGGGGRPVTILDRGTILSKNIRRINFLGTEANVNAGGDEVTIEPIVVSDTAPSSPFEGQLWVDTS